MIEQQAISVKVGRIDTVDVCSEVQGSEAAEKRMASRLLHLKEGLQWYKVVNF